MSYTTLFVFKGDKVYSQTDYQNAHGGAMAIWMMMGRRHIGPGFVIFDDDQSKRLFALADDPSIPWFARVTLMSTFDNVVVRREDLPRLVKAFQMFDAEYATAWKQGSVWSVPDQAEDIRRAHDDGAQAVGWNQTSVCDSVFRGRFDEDEVEFNLADHTCFADFSTCVPTTGVE